MNPRLQDRITVLRDGEEVDVFNWLYVQRPAVVQGYNPVVKTFDADIGIGHGDKPDAVTTWVANEVRNEFGIDVTDHDIEVIDVESDEVTVL